MNLNYAAIDMHSNQPVLVVIDEKDQTVCRGRLNNDLELVLLAPAPYREQLAGVAVESTYNWYRAWHGAGYIAGLR
jgi:hypothetical protein